MIFHLLFCSAWGFLLTSGSPTRDIPCPPPPPCPLPPCDDPVPTYYPYHGKLCQGCSQCPTPPPSQDNVTCPYLPCPLLPCPENDRYATYYEYHGKLCQGCSQCRHYDLHNSGDVKSKRQLITLPCPVVDCANPGPCPVNLVPTTFYAQGRQCPGCPVCPVQDESPVHP